jgi:hypothetical protein
MAQSSDIRVEKKEKIIPDDGIEMKQRPLLICCFHGSSA